MENQQPQQWEQQPRATPPSSNTYQIFGIISLVLGILAFLFSFIPCLGMYAFVPGIIGLALGITGFILANKVTGSKGIVIGGIILSALGIAMAVWQYTKVHDAITDITHTLHDSIKMHDIKRSWDSSMHELDTTGMNMKITIDTTE